MHKGAQQSSIWEQCHASHRMDLCAVSSLFSFVLCHSHEDGGMQCHRLSQGLDSISQNCANSQSTMKTETGVYYAVETLKKIEMMTPKAKEGFIVFLFILKLK